MESIYITSNIIYQNQQLYSKKNKYHKVIQNSNWEKYLSSYGWVPIDSQWKEKLNTDSNINLFGLLECGGQGDCLFHCLAEGLNNILDPQENKYDSQDCNTKLPLRSRVASWTSSQTHLKDAS